MARKIISIKKGDKIPYDGYMNEVIDLYSYIAYLKECKSGKVKCVCLGDLVIAGIESPNGMYWPRDLNPVINCAESK